MVNDPEYIEKIVGKIKEIPAEEIIAAIKKVDLEDAIQTVRRFLEACDKNLDGEISIKCDGLTRNSIEEVFDAHNELQEEFFWQQVRIRNDYIPVSFIESEIAKLNASDGLEDEIVMNYLKNMLKERKAKQ